MKQKFIVVIFLFILLPFLAHGQTFKATAKLDSTNILIGDYLKVHLEVVISKGTPIIFPQINAKVIEEAQYLFDWIESSKIDTTYTSLEQILKQTVTITAFDSGSYVFPSLPIFSLDSTLLAQTDPLSFTVTTIPVDTTAAYKDIKGNLTTPLTLHELWLYFKKYGFLFLVISLLISAILYLFVKYLKSKKSTKNVEIIKVKSKEKPHIIALHELEKLRHKKLWEQGKVKEYYSELTEIIRIYLEGRWEIYAMEMVSSEIIEALKEIHVLDGDINSLVKMFSISDLVKFAKWDPLPTDHDMAFKSAKEFIEKTAETNDVNDNKL